MAKKKKGMVGAMEKMGSPSNMPTEVIMQKYPKYDSAGKMVDDSYTVLEVECSRMAADVRKNNPTSRY